MRATPLPPRLVVSATASGHGKTTVAVGLMAALRERGLQVAPAKVGPDYIDPGYHALATGRPGRNLDPHLCGTELVAPLFAHGAAGAEVAVIEGVMGLFDGRLGTDPVGRKAFGSTAHAAGLVRAPVVLVLDASHSSRTLAAEALGMARYDDVDVAGVVLNHTSSPRNIAECRRALDEVGIGLLGALPRDPDLVTPSRHLGLVPAAEREQAAAMVEHAGRLVAEHLDLDAVLRVARSAPEVMVEPWDPSTVVRPVDGRPRVAVAGGRAFTFRYPETVELLQAAGCEVVDLDPLTDTCLPPGTSALYLGGGFPELHADQLAANLPLREQVRDLVGAGLPTVAECAGLLYLCRSIDGRPMSGALDLTARMAPRLQLGYRTPVAVGDTLLADAGQQVASHEFHRTVVELAGPEKAAPDGGGSRITPAWQLGEAETLDGLSADPAGTGRPTVHASYQHLHWAGFPQAAQRLALAAADWATHHPLPAGDAAASGASEEGAGIAPEEGRAVAPNLPAGDATRVGHDTARAHSATPDARTPLGDGVRIPLDGARTTRHDGRTTSPDLTHHGDADLAEGLVDLAVNVRRTAPPGWLAEQLARPETWAPYPDARQAREALAGRHGVAPEMVLPTSGAAEAFALVARALPIRQSLVVHPQFTEPEHALRLAGHLPRRLLLEPPFRLHPELVDPTADLVVVGNPTNPTGVLHPAAVLQQLRAPGRVLLVDEAFMDALPGEPESLVGQDMTGLLVTRSLTKTWGLAGIRAGYVVGDPELVARLERQQSPWAVSTPALAAMIGCSTPEALAFARADLGLLEQQRRLLVDELTRIGLPPVAKPCAPFVLVDTGRLGSVRESLATRGFAVRRGDSFPGLGPQWIRLAVRDETTTRALVGALEDLMEGHR
ncbi:cobyrinate a,c-diamide synthase [Luteococcus peritonei]|uniref:Hydrogenobyrinate a,c-diamide synthase n=1 Tax=Luteococcus peritonei TaxID=88874 RepID=A0ABW4RUD9_9ACTN